MPDNAAEPRPQTRPFAAWLQEQRNGLLHSELSERLADLVAAIAEHEKGGTLTLTLAIKPSKVYGAVEVEDTVKVKAPEADRDAGLFFADSHGNLSRRDPRQPELPLRDATNDAATTSNRRSA